MSPGPRIVLATGNLHKVAELEPLLAGARVSGAPAGFDPEETGVTLLQNAWIKAAALRGEVDDDALVLADDSGLVVHALGGRPGVFSSRYAGPDATFADNCRRLREELEGVEDRSAASVCVLVALGSDAYQPANAPEAAIATNMASRMRSSTTTLRARGESAAPAKPPRPLASRTMPKCQAGAPPLRRSSGASPIAARTW